MSSRGRVLAANGSQGDPKANNFARAPERYISKHLAEQILTSKTALASGRKQVTVLFADSDILALNPAEVVQPLPECLAGWGRVRRGEY